MTKLEPRLTVKTRPITVKENILTGEGYRISVLTPSLVRVEANKNNVFTDEATQYIWYRDFPAVPFEQVDVSADRGILPVSVEGGKQTIVLETETCRFVFSKTHKKMMGVFLKKENKYVPCNNKENLGGTCRTLDGRNGRVRLKPGVLSKNGVAVLTDDGLILTEEGTLGARKEKERDEYIFAYGKEYKKAIDAYFYLTGETPMLPRYVLGNWWSRYYAYTQKEYLDLMDRFKKENIPLTVATVDMDWHWVNVNKKFGTNYRNPNPLQTEGWTGYSWNTDLFPDYRAFLKELHDKNLHTTLNLHPADGVRAYEDMYEEMAKRMGIDPASKETVPFDLSSNEFINAYFDVLHRPYEDEGVDFWWMDWQQGKKSTVKDLDPLWALNHYHYLDNARDGRKGMLLSRYCGIGSHRYPIGFSGDYIVTWKSLKFQPEFTNRASNIGYDWWSHDIGGHMMGITDDELYLRWCQYGVFSPINRLHSSNFLLQGKEPWKRSETVRRITGDYLRLRHALLPYLYTAAYKTHKENIPLCNPMYALYPEEENAYKVPNEYFFGTELIVCPVTSKTSKKTKLSKTRVWLPEGRYTDIFTGRIYQGGQLIDAYRDVEFVPVFAKQGAIVPLSGDEGNSAANPTKMTVWVYRGNNEYTLYEDNDKRDEDCKAATTTMVATEKGNTITFTVKKTEGDLSVLPERREYAVWFRDVEAAKAICNGKEVPFENGKVTFVTDGKEDVVIELGDVVAMKNPDAKEEVNVVFSRSKGKNIWKTLMYIKIGKAKTEEELKKAIKHSLFPRCVKGAALEKLL